MIKHHHRVVPNSHETAFPHTSTLKAILAIGSGIRSSLFFPDYFVCVLRPWRMLWMLLTRIKTHQRVVHNFPFDLSQNCLFMAFKPLLVLDVESDQLSAFSLSFFVFQGVGGSLGVPAKARTCLLYIGEGVVTF